MRDTFMTDSQQNSWHTFGRALGTTLKASSQWLVASMQNAWQERGTQETVLKEAWKQTLTSGHQCAQEVETGLGRVQERVATHVDVALKRCAGVSAEDVVVSKAEWEALKQRESELQEAVQAAQRRRAATPQEADLRREAAAKAPAKKAARKAPVVKKAAAPAKKGARGTTASPKKRASGAKGS